MTAGESTSCYLIGTESLLIQCADVLFEQGFEVAGAVSSEPAILRWAQEKGLRALRPDDGLAQALRQRPFDYLFSIANLAIIPRPILEIPRRGTVNFHDGPLPRYAGLHATTWALLGRESTHGVTWHLVEGGVDEGDILEQEIFALEPGETALTLNAKCYEAGIRTFRELARKIRSGGLQPRKQDFAQRTYFPAAKRPAAACGIAWQEPAEAIDAAVRAMDFGAYANPVGLPKALLPGGGAVCVLGCEVLARRTGASPGTIVGVEDGAITVATASSDVSFRKVLRPDGSAAAPRELGLEPGAVLASLPPEAASRAHLLHEDVARHEPFWTQKLETVEPFASPYARAAKPGGSVALATLRAKVPAGIDAEAAALPEAPAVGDFLVAAVCAFLSRLGGASSVAVAYSEPSIRQRVGDLDALFAAWVPLQVAVDRGSNFSSVARSAVAELATVRRAKTYARDLIARQPALRAAGARLDAAAWSVRVEQSAASGTGFSSRNEPAAALTVRVEENGSQVEFIHDAARLAPEDARSLVDSFEAFLDGLLAMPSSDVRRIPVIGPVERNKLESEWQAAAADYPRASLVHEAFEAQVDAQPDAIAVVSEGEAITYRELDDHAARLAQHLRGLGVGPDSIVGLCMERSIDLMVGLLGILKAGGAYLPLDPSYPAERLEFMLEDSQAPIVLTQSRLADRWRSFRGKTVSIDGELDRAAIELGRTDRFSCGALPESLAYVIYTSGSTGRPKGVQIEHRNVVNFFRGMDDRVERDRAGAWLAVTSLSFDISVLELLWTLARGFKVVLHGERGRQHVARAGSRSAPHRKLDFSLFYFASDESAAGAQKYRLLIEGAKFADRSGFEAVWTPERHFHAFGGLYPNPAVTSAALATITERVQIRSGSVVLPLHHPIRVAEEWALVDNLSNGRVGISFASGWHPSDFVLRPENHADAKKILMRDIEVVRRLWRGEKVAFPGPKGAPIEVGILPRPVQAELPFWITAAGNPETFRMAGEVGANLLTHLLGQNLKELGGKIETYRQARREHGHSGNGRVTLMLHTFLAADLDTVREKVRKPLTDYLRSAASLIQAHATSFPAFKKKMADGASADDLFRSLSPEDLEALLEHAFERYFETSGLFGTPQSCLARIDELEQLGVDEVACLIDFGIGTDDALESLRFLDEVRLETARRATAEASGESSIPDLIRRHGVTHLQCTPSMAGMLIADPESRDALRSMRTLLVGGEALPASVAAGLRAAVQGRVVNMYGPTETTVWSSTHELEGSEDPVPIGKAIANTQLYVLDQDLELVPPGLPGELYIGGDGVARGYLRRPELTAERFVRNPHGPTGSRLYRTGDLVRRRGDGTLEFLGRIDHQVKVRGHRIELGEIEERLREHPSVREAVVVAREDVPGDQRLVAYFVPRSGAGASAGSADAAALRAHLGVKLPDFMVPSHFVSLAALPLTPNGKVDRKALPPPESAPAPADRAYSVPESELEQTLAKIWQESLNVPRVGLEDNFFDLGGHSLLVVQVLSKLREATGRQIPITDVFRYPTVRSLARALGGESSAQSSALSQSEERGAARRELLQRRGPRNKSRASGE